MLSVFNKIVIAFVIFLSFITHVQANLIIAPMRVVFEDRTRTESIVLINSSNKNKKISVILGSKISVKARWI